MSKAEWVDDARCLPIHGRAPSGIDFFSEDPEEEARAVKFCSLCPVRTQCLKDQQDWEATQPQNVELTGVFGGKTGAERDAARKRNQ